MLALITCSGWSVCANLPVQQESGQAGIGLHAYPDYTSLQFSLSAYNPSQLAMMLR